MRLETSLLIRFGVCLREGSCPPGARASRPHRSGRSPAGPLCLRFTQRAPILRIRLGEEHPATASPAHSRRQWRWLASCLQKKGAGGTPALPGGLPPMTESHQGGKIAGVFRNRLSLKAVHLYSCLFVFIRGSSFSTATCPAHPCLLSPRRRRFKSRVPRPHGLPNVMPDSEFCKRLT